jgi:carbon monoxide dehydrogenase subunit G
MELHGDRLVPAPVAATWAALNDPETLKACIAGCESLARTGDDAYTAVVALKIGPVSARFKGNLKMTNVAPPTGYTINFDGQGGVAGFGRGSADVRLAPGRRRHPVELRPGPWAARWRRSFAPDRCHRRQDHRRLLQGLRSASAGAVRAGRSAGAGSRARRRAGRYARLGPARSSSWRPSSSCCAASAPQVRVARRRTQSM